MDSLVISKDKFEALCTGRKMLLSEVARAEEVRGQEVHLGLARANDVASKLNIPLSSVLDSASSADDLPNGVKVCRAGEGYRRTSQREGKDYYTYSHLATTSTVPDLMALRVTLHCTDEHNVVLNGGHGAREIIYVTKGTVRMHWDAPAGGRQSVDLGHGDSAYLKPGVSHSFMAVGAESELIAFNF